MSERILIIEDEEKLARFVEMELSYEGYQAQKAHDGRTGLALALSGDFDLVILDIMLPGLSGMEVLRRIRREMQTPVIMLTARDAVMDKVSGLDGGADDYMTKPFEIEELLARIRRALRATAQKSGAVQNGGRVLTACGVALDPLRHTVEFAGTQVELTKREFDLVQFLMENKGLVFSRDALLDKVWGYDYMGDTNVVDVYVRYIRSKIDDVFGIKLIHTVRGVGYMVKDEQKT
ncbi:MAG: response regulator transcription factor [Clostridiales bacterium]|nr:response regulator transcription factor [Clostridiales bacterium]